MESTEEIKSQPTTDLCRCIMAHGMTTTATGVWTCADCGRPRWEA